MNYNAGQSSRLKDERLESERLESERSKSELCSGVEFKIGRRSVL